jgi:hypothetical protein
MTWNTLRFLLYAGAAMTAVLAIVAPQAQTHSCQPPQAGRDGWSTSFVAGCVDRVGKFAGGSQIMHLVPHKGALYAASGYWMDSRNVLYGGKDPNAGWAQVLRLSGANEPWVADLELGPRHLRTELLKSVTFDLDGNGRPLPAPVALLFASTYDAGGSRGISFFVRDDERSSWSPSKIIDAAVSGERGEDKSVRAAAIHRDRVTGLESLFLSVGIHGIYAGRYAPSLPGKIDWASAPEPGTTTETRILSLVEANGSLFFSDGTRILRRIDGPSPRYAQVLDLSSDVPSGTDRGVFESIGGIRGLSAIDGPIPGKQSLIFMWHGGPRSSMGCIIRLDLQPDGSYARVREGCLAEQIRAYLGGAPIYRVAGAYNRFIPLHDSHSTETVYAVGLETLLSVMPEDYRFGALMAHNMRYPKGGGFYAGALYALRDSQARWRVGEVNGKYMPGHPELVSIYDIALSPFSEPGQQTVYFGGYDANFFPSSDTAWVYSTGLTNLIGR